MISNQIGIITSESQVYETSAWGKTDQKDFLNKAISVKTSLSPQELLKQISIIESKMGRLRKEKWGPRNIDVDILFYDEEIIENDNLKIPHPQITNRNFVLVPLMDICPDFVHPLHDKTIAALLEECTDTGEVRRYL